ncbi:hypothetical protein THRCLA_22609 [Thraustotheca clavata]|uniref:GCF C-terminal domain-containing protein n=1 Tax=Thraustotheca clavata TaxID=74557 RepID=A0A1V9YW82_9STRA|nr:hypothetical protein THRCLA_22609 [Thraustotheca clavata]
MFRSRKKTQRNARQNTIEQDDLKVQESVQDESMDLDAVRARLHQKNKKIPLQKPKKSNVEYDDENEREIPLKKRKIARAQVLSNDERASATVYSDYSMEKLQELIDNQKFQSKPILHEEEEFNEKLVQEVDYKEEKLSHEEDEKDVIEENFIPMMDRPQKPQKIQEASLSEPEQDAFEDEGPDTQWEQEQLRRAGLVKGSSAPLLKQNDLTFQSFGQLQQVLIDHQADLVDRVDTRDRDNMRASVDAMHCAQAISEMESQLEKDSQTFDLAQGMWEYASTLCHCLRAKLDCIAATEALVPYDRKMSEASAKIWDDVDDEYKDLEQIIEHFNAWKKADPEMYKAIYGDLALAQLVAPFVRVELTAWQPWTASRSFADMQWAKLLESSMYESSLELVEAHLRRYLPYWNPLLPSQFQNMNRLIGLLQPTTRAIHLDIQNRFMEVVNAIDYSRISSTSVDLRLLKDGLRTLTALDNRYDEVFEALLEGEAKHWVQCCSAGINTLLPKIIATILDTWPQGKKYPNILVNYAVLLRRFREETSNQDDLNIAGSLLQNIESRLST